MMQMMNNRIRRIAAWLVCCLSMAAQAQVGPFTGQAQISLGGMQGASMQDQVIVPVNVDLSGMTAYDTSASQVPAALGEYRIVLSYDGALLEPQLSSGQVPGGQTAEFSGPVMANVAPRVDASLLVLQASQLNSSQPVGLVNVAEIPFLIKAEAGATASISVLVQDLRTPLALLSSPTALLGGVQLPYAVAGGQISVNAPAAPAFDADVDGLPDSWELAHGLDPGNALDASGDSDSDGFSVLQEFQAGTDIASTTSFPPGVSGLSYVPFNDEFADNVYTDRWYVTYETPLAIYSFNESADQLAASLQAPSSSCNRVKLAAYAAVDVSNGILAASLNMNAGGVMSLGLQQGQSISNRVAVAIDANLQQARLQSWVNNVLSEQVLALNASVFAAPLDVRLIKTADSYQLYVNNVAVGNVTNTALGNSQLRPYLQVESCLVDTQTLDAQLERVQILLDRDGDGLPDAQEDANSNGLLDTGETDPLVANDSDGDGRLDGFDNCVNQANADQLDSNANGIGDACEPAPPGITGIWPGSAAIGESISVFIFGSHFTLDGSTEVYFNGVRQYLVAPVSSEMLIVRVNVSASLFGAVNVVTPLGSANSGSQFGVPASGLQLTGVWPGNVVTGEATSVFLFGSGFTLDGTTEVYFNGIRQYLLAPVSSEMIIVRLGSPTAALSGPVTITVPGVGSVNSSQDLIVAP